MSIISINNVSFTYPTGNTPVFDNITVSFDTDWKTGLIGRNGKGLKRNNYNVQPQNRYGYR